MYYIVLRGCLLLDDKIMTALNNPIDEDNINNEYEAVCVAQDICDLNQKLLRNPNFIDKEMLADVFAAIKLFKLNHEGKRWNG